MVFQIDSANGEPYIRLPLPYSSIRITLPRTTDVEPLVAMLNDPQVYPFLSNPIFPVTQQHGLEFITRVKGNCEATFREEVWPHLQANSSSDGSVKHGENVIKIPNALVVSENIVETLRETQEDGTEIYLGGVTLQRHRYTEVEDKEEREALHAENNQKAPGDPSIVWAFAGKMVHSVLALDSPLSS